jgi:hypothetical protein
VRRSFDLSGLFALFTVDRGLGAIAGRRGSLGPGPRRSRRCDDGHRFLVWARRRHRFGSRQIGHDTFWRSGNDLSL